MRTYSDKDDRCSDNMAVAQSHHVEAVLLKRSAEYGGVGLHVL